MIAVVLLVAITTVLAAVVYYTVSTMVGQVEVTPYVYMSRSYSNSTTAYLRVSGIESEHKIHEYMAVLLIDDQRDDQSTMRPIAVGTVGNITYFDLGDEMLSVGDEFTVTTEPGRHYELAIIYIDNGNRAGFVDWNS